MEQLTELTDVSAVVSSEGRDNITVFTSVMEPTGGVQQQMEPANITAEPDWLSLIQILDFNSFNVSVQQR